MLLTEETDDDEEFSGSDDDDDDFAEDLEAISRACTLTGTNPTDLKPTPTTASTAAVEIPEEYDVSSDSDEEDYLELLRGTDQRFTEAQSLLTKPLMMLPPATFSDEDDDDNDDYDIIRGIEDRFSLYINEFSQKGVASSIENPIDLVPPPESDFSEFFHRPENQDSDDEASTPLLSSSRFPNSAHMLLEAIQKNRECQKFIRSKLIQIDAKIQENEELMRKVKILKDYQASCKRRIGLQLSQKKDPHVLLVSAQKASNCGKKSPPALLNGPEENPHAEAYKRVLNQFPVSLNRKNWEDKENAGLENGIKQQFRQLLFQKAIDRIKNNEGPDCLESVDNVSAQIEKAEITPVMMRSFLPKVDWDSLAKTCLNRRLPEECEARWLNFEDKLINHSPWDNIEDKKLLYIVQERGVENWVDIAVSLGTNRTPSQCLCRYQRSLNGCILKREWTEEEDKQLCAAVEGYGESNWQAVASVIDGRTGTQCSNRWLKTLHPARTIVGRWRSDEDMRLTVAVMLFGAKSWPKIAEFVPGRTQVQCRERWSNSLDPKVNMGKWSEEEDSRLIVAVEEYAQLCQSGSNVKDKLRWAKVAGGIPGRTDNQCRRRAMVLFPNLKLFLHETRLAQQRFGITNFVAREEERPALGVADFVPLALMNSAFESGNVGPRKKRKRRSGGSKKKKPEMGDQSFSEEEPVLPDGGGLSGEDAIPKKKRVLRACRKKKGGSDPSESVQDGSESSEAIQDLMKKKKDCDSSERIEDVTKKKKRQGCDSSELIRDLIKEKKKKKQGGSENVDPCKKRKRTLSGSKKIPKAQIGSEEDSLLFPNGGDMSGKDAITKKKRVTRACKKKEVSEPIEDVGTRKSSSGRLIKRRPR